MTPSPVNPMGVKGVGEAGTIGSTPAVVNAVVDALSPLGVRHIDMPLTPQRVWRAMQAARRRRVGERGGALMIPAHVRLLARIIGRRGARACLGGTVTRKLLAGGQSLIPLMKFRLTHAGSADRYRRPPRAARASPRPSGGFRIGALTTYRELLDRPAVLRGLSAPARRGQRHRRRPGPQPGNRRRLARPTPTLPRTCRRCPGPRRRGRDPVKRRVARRVALADFISGTFDTRPRIRRDPDGAVLPALPRGAGTAWVALEQPASGYSLVGVAAVVGDVHGARRGHSTTCAWH